MVDIDRLEPSDFPSGVVTSTSRLAEDNPLVADTSFLRKNKNSEKFRSRHQSSGFFVAGFFCPSKFNFEKLI